MTTAELEGYLDEALPAVRMAEIETLLRHDAQLVARVADLSAQRDAGVHSLGSFWRRGRISCPTRAQIGSFLLGALPDDSAKYITFHLEIVGCRYCAANMADLQRRQAESEVETEGRRRRYFQSSAGYLRRSNP
jgi:hypothetical protein